MSAVLRRFLLAAAVVLIAGAAPPSIGAAAGTDPAMFINNLGAQLRAVTSYPSPEQKLAKFRELFREDFDVASLGRFVLGRFWPMFTPAEQQEFLGLFENFVVLTYSKRLLEYADGGAGPRVTGSRSEQDGAVVSSEISRGPGSWTGHSQTVQPLKVDWRVSAGDGKYKISDVVIDGLSWAPRLLMNMAGSVPVAAPIEGGAAPAIRTTAAANRKRRNTADTFEISGGLQITAVQ